MRSGWSKCSPFQTCPCSRSSIALSLAIARLCVQSYYTYADHCEGSPREIVGCARMKTMKALQQPSHFTTHQAVHLVDILHLESSVDLSAFAWHARRYTRHCINGTLQARLSTWPRQSFSLLNAFAGSAAARPCYSMFMPDSSFVPFLHFENLSSDCILTFALRTPPHHR